VSVRERRRRVLLTGMFDMLNYGDLLFPLMARRRLEAHGIDVVPIAPTATPTGVVDAIDARDIGSMLETADGCDGIVVGGGYLIHTHPLSFVEDYPIGEAGDWAGAGLWLGATLAAALRDVPIAWNAPGVLHPFGARQRPLVAAALRATDYVAVRDRGAVQLLAAPDDVAVQQVPDPIAELARLWPRAGLEQTFRQLLARKQANPDARYVAVHLRVRSLAGLAMVDLAARLAVFAREHALVPILVAVGRSHDDPSTARDCSRQLTIPHVLLDEPASLREITSVFAHADLYVGASLHGYVASAVYGTPGVLVARPAYRKFAGFLEHTGRLQDLARDWSSAWELAAERGREARSERVPARVLTALDTHWDRLVAALAEPASKRSERDAFVRSLVRLGAASAGMGWALRPFLDPLTLKGLVRRPTAALQNEGTS
jgi:polysaccharide pyruvyl transferase WcaK-like protein